MARDRPGRDIDGERIDAQVLANLFGQDVLPTRIGRYRVLSHLGEGGMGVVYLAYDARLDRKVAIKLLHATSDARARERAIREARALAQLVHPNVVTVYDVHTDDADVAIAMEFVAGQTLDVWAAARPRRWRELRAVMLDVAHGVAAAHAVDLVHQDLKLTNVVVDPTGRARVLDFGLARIHFAEASAPAPGEQDPRSSHGGTPGYMAPEQPAWSVRPPISSDGA